MWLLAAAGDDAAASDGALSARLSDLLDRALALADSARAAAEAAAAATAQQEAEALAQRMATATVAARAPERVSDDLDAAVKRAIVAGFAYESETDEEEEKAEEQRRAAQAATAAARAAREVRRSGVSAAAAAGAGLDGALAELAEVERKPGAGDAKGAGAGGGGSRHVRVVVRGRDGPHPSLPPASPSCTPQGWGGERGARAQGQGGGRRMRRAATRVRAVSCLTAAARRQYRGRPTWTRLCLLEAAAAAPPQVQARRRAAMRVAAVAATWSLGIRYRLAWTTGEGVVGDPSRGGGDSACSVVGVIQPSRPKVELRHRPHLPACATLTPPYSSLSSTRQGRRARPRRRRPRSRQGAARGGGVASARGGRGGKVRAAGAVREASMESICPLREARRSRGRWRPEPNFTHPTRDTPTSPRAAGLRVSSRGRRRCSPAHRRGDQSEATPPRRVCVRDCHSFKHLRIRIRLRLHRVPKRSRKALLDTSTLGALQVAT